MAIQLIGRDDELAAAGRLLDMLLAPGPAACVIHGEPGIGKSVVLQAVVDAADSHDWRILMARPVEAEATVSHAGLGDLLATVSASELNGLPPVLRRALDVALLYAPASDPPPDIRVIGTAVSQLIAALARDNPVVIAIDDAPWLDRPTERVIAFAARRLAPARVGFIASMRSVADAGWPLGLADAVEDDRRFSLRIGPMSVTAIHDLLADRLDIRLTRPMLIRLHAMCGGNPFYALELARDVSRVGHAAALRRDLGVGVEMVKLPGQRIALMPSATRAALLAASAMSDPTLASIAFLTGGRSALDDLLPATDAGIAEVRADKVRFVHPLLAAAAYASGSETERRDLHRRLSVWTEDAEERARHVALGAPEPDLASAAVVEEGARQAALRGAPDAAAELAEAAAELTPVGSVAERRSLLIAAAGYHIQAGALSRARVLLEAVVSGAGPCPDRGFALGLLGEVRFQQDSFGDAIGFLERGLAELGDDPRAVGVELGLTFALIQSTDVRRGRIHARAAVAHAERLRFPSLLASAISVEQIAAVMGGEQPNASAMTRALALAADGEVNQPLLRPTFIAGMLDAWTGRPAEARGPLRATAQTLVDQGQEALLPPVLLWLVFNELQLGDVKAAARYAKQATDAAGQVGSAMFAGVASVATGWVAALVGDVTSARASATYARDVFTAIGWRSALLWPVATLGAVEWSLGDASGTAALLSPLIALSDEIGIMQPTLRPFVVDEIEALVALGRVTEGEALLARLEEDARRIGRPPSEAVASRCRGLLLASTGELEAGLASLEDAMVEHGRSPHFPMDVARTALAKGIVERRLKRKGAARRSLGLAIEKFDALGAGRWSDRARSELVRVGARPTSPDDLTETESRVAALAARGLTNRAVGDALFLAPKSVEAVLSRVYAKLGIHSRAELGVWSATRRDPKE